MTRKKTDITFGSFFPAEEFTHRGLTSCSCGLNFYSLSEKSLRKSCKTALKGTQKIRERNEIKKYGKVARRSGRKEICGEGAED